MKFVPLLVPSFNFKVPPTVDELPIKISSIALLLSTSKADEAVNVPCTWSSWSVKYCPPITVILLASPEPSTPPSPIKSLSPRLPCAPVP